MSFKNCAEHYWERPQFLFFDFKLNPGSDHQYGHIPLLLFFVAAVFFCLPVGDTLSYRYFMENVTLSFDKHSGARGKRSRPQH